MTKVNFSGSVPAYFPITFSGSSGLIYGLNVVPGEQLIADSAWAELQNYPSSADAITTGVLSLVVPEPEAPVEPVSEALPVSEVVPPTGEEDEAKARGEASGEGSLAPEEPEAPVVPAPKAKRN